jgi:predicted nucleic acid-binding protein
VSDFVVDSSVTMAWCFEDETTEYTESVLTKLSKGAAAAVPTIWPYEVTNVLIFAERQKRIPQSKVVQFLKELQSFDITIDPQNPARIFHDVLSVAKIHKLTAYDAAYLELALREGLPIATLDVSLRRAAKTAGVKVHGA